ncbi:UNVERIFIED_CONTAM: AMP-binding protein, partial [Bacillus mycoides]
LGVRAGDRVAMMCPNVLAYPIGMMGILRCGATQVNVNPLYSVQELENQLRDADVRVILAHRASLQTLWQVLPHSNIEAVVIADDDPLDGDAHAAIEPPTHAIRLLRFSQGIAADAGAAFSAPVIDASDIAYLQYTGGTTGVSKGAMLTHANLLANIAQFRKFAAHA